MVAKIVSLSIIFLTFIAFMTCSCEAAPKKQYTAIELFKGYALTTCIANGLPDKDSAAEYAAAAAREYSEHGTFPIEAETQARVLGLKFLSRKYKNIYGDNLIFIKCIDFYNSKELDQLIKKYPNQQLPGSGSWRVN